MVTSFGSSSSGTLESLGFDAYHRRDSAVFPESTASQITDLDLGGELIEYVHVSSLLAGEISVDQHIRGGQTAYNTGSGFWLGLDGTTAKFSLGDSAGDHVTWDGTTLSIIGTLSVGSDVGGWVITADTLYSLASGTPTASPNEGIVLDSSNPVITVYEGTAKRIELGYLSAAVFGLKGYATDGVTTLFELSDTQNYIAGWTISATTLANSTNIILDASNKAISINSATFGTDGIQLQYNAGNPRAYIGDGAGQFFSFDGTNVSWGGAASSLSTAGKLATTSATIGGWEVVSGYIYNLQSGTPTVLPTDGLVLASGDEALIIYEGTAKRIELGYLSAAVYGLRGYATDGSTVLFELSDTQNSISGLTVASTSLAVSTNIIIDSAGKAFSINSATFGTDGIQLQYNAGNPRAYIGNGSTYFFNFDGTNISWGAVNTTLDTAGKLTTTSADIGGWIVETGYIYNLQSGTPTASPNDGVVLASGNEALIVYEDTAKRVEVGYLSVGVYGIKAYATDGTTVIFEASDTQQRMAGWHFTDTLLRSGITDAASNVLIDSANSLIRLGPTTGDYLTADGANLRIRSSNYSSGAFGAGFTLEPDLLEVGNASIRGRIQMATFVASSISAVNGDIVVAVGSDTLNADMTAADASTITITGDMTLAVNDRIRIKEGFDDEWMVVSNIASAPTYTVTRDSASAYGANANPAWTKGATVVNFGQSGDGGVFITANDTNAPFVSVYTHAGSPWSAMTTRLRLGNLNGYLGYVADIYGLGVGSSTAGEANITIEPTNGLRIRTGTTTLFQVDNAGNATIGGWTLDSDEIKDAAGVVGMSSAVTGADDIRFWAGDATPGSAEFRVYESGALVASSATITGAITATSGAIGGFTVGADYVRDAADSMGLASTVTGGNDIRFWAGETFANRATAPFRVYEDGSIVATSATITISTLGGFDIGADYIRDAANSFGLASTVTAGDDVRFWAGAAFADRATAPLYITESGAIVGTNVTMSGGLNAEVSFTAGEAVASGDTLAVTSADTVSRYAPTALPSEFDQSSTTIGTYTYTNSCRPGFLLPLSTSLFAFATRTTDDNGPGIVRIPITASTGAVGSIGADTTVLTPTTTSTTISLVKAGTNKILITTCAGNEFKAAVSDFSSSISTGTVATIDNSNVSEGFGEYISDSHVLFLAQDTSNGNIQFSKYTLSGTTLTASSTGTVTTTFAGDTYVIKGVRQFADSAYFLIIVQNTTDATAYALVAHYDTGSSTFDSVGAPVAFTSVSATISNGAVMASLSSTQMMVYCPTTTTAGKYFLVTRSTVTPTVGTLNAATATGISEGYCMTPVNSRCAYLSTTSGTTATVALLELNADGTDIVTRATQTYSTTSGYPVGAFRANSTRMGLFLVESSFDPKAYTGPLTLPALTAIAKAAAAAAASVTGIVSGVATNVSGLTAGDKVYAEIGGLLTDDGNGTPDKVGVAKDTNEIILRSW